MHTLLGLSVHQQLVTDRRHRYEQAATRSRRHRPPVAPDLIRTADLGSSILPVRSPGAAVRVGDTSDPSRDPARAPARDPSADHGVAA